MTATLFIFSGIVAALLLVLGWALRAPGKSSRGKFDLASSGRIWASARHLCRAHQAGSVTRGHGVSGEARIAGDCPSSTPRAPQGRASLSDAPSRGLSAFAASGSRGRCLIARGRVSSGIGTSLVELGNSRWRYQLIRAGFRYGLLPVPAAQQPQPHRQPARRADGNIPEGTR